MIRIIRIILNALKKYKIYKFIVGIILVFVVINIYFVINARDYLPLNVDYPTININTPDMNNPTVKSLTFKCQAVNKSKETVYFTFHYTKDKSTESWYPYYTIIPDEHVTEILCLQPEEMKEFHSQITIESEDERSINTLFSNVEVKYEIIEKK